MKFLDAMKTLETVAYKQGIGSETWLAYVEVSTLVEMLKVYPFEDAIAEYIENHYEGDIEDAEEAKGYLGDLYDDEMSDMEAIEEAREMQVDYYLNGGGADFYEILDKAIEIYDE